MKRTDDSRAVAACYGRNRSVLLAVARRIVHDEDVAEDCVQDATLGVLRRVSEYAPANVDWLPLLTRAVRNRALNMRRTDARFSREDNLGAMVDTHASAADRLDEESLKLEVTRALVRMPGSWRRVFYHRRICGMSFAHTAEVVGRGEQTVKNVFCKATAHIASTLAPSLGTRERRNGGGSARTP